jgi:hypothetical protein
LRPKPNSIIAAGSEIGVIGAKSNGSAPAVPAKKIMLNRVTMSIVRNFFMTSSSLNRALADVRYLKATTRKEHLSFDTLSP